VEILTGDAITLAGDRTIEQLDGEASAAWWQEYVNQEPVGEHSTGSAIRSHCRPRAVGTLAVEAFNVQTKLSNARMRVSPGLGDVRIVVPDGALVQESYLSVRNALQRFADNRLLISGDQSLKQGIDIWGESPATIDVMNALKEQFDPSRVLNPGRFAGFI